MAGMIMQALQQQQGGGGGGMPGQPGQPGQPNVGQQYAEQVSALKGADPGGLVRQLKAMKQISAIMLVQNLERLPNVAGKISKLIPMFDQIIKEAEQASQVNSAVRPIQMGAAQPPSPEGMGGGGGMGGGMGMGGF